MEKRAQPPWLFFYYFLVGCPFWLGFLCHSHAFLK